MVLLILGVEFFRDYNVKFVCGETSFCLLFPLCVSGSEQCKKGFAFQVIELFSRYTKPPPSFILKAKGPHIYSLWRWVGVYQGPMLEADKQSDATCNSYMPENVGQGEKKKLKE